MNFENWENITPDTESWENYKRHIIEHPEYIPNQSRSAKIDSFKVPAA